MAKDKRRPSLSSVPNVATLLFSSAKASVILETDQFTAPGCIRLCLYQETAAGLGGMLQLVIVHHMGGILVCMRIAAAASGAPCCLLVCVQPPSGFPPRLHVSGASKQGAFLPAASRTCRSHTMFYSDSNNNNIIYSEVEAFKRVLVSSAGCRLGSSS